MTKYILVGIGCVCVTTVIVLLFGKIFGIAGLAGLAGGCLGWLLLGLCEKVGLIEWN